MDFLYINGDHWAAPSFIDQHTNSRSLNFKNIFVINRSLSGSSNLDIINRTQSDLKELKTLGIIPNVCVALTEIGRDPIEEFKLVSPTGLGVTDYLKTVLLAEIQLLEDILNDYNHYITTGWTTDPTGNKSIVDFINVDKADVEVYAVDNGIYSWLSDRQQIFKFSDESFNLAVKNKLLWESRLLSSELIARSLHIKHNQLRPYNNWIDYVLNKLELYNAKSAES